MKSNGEKQTKVGILVSFGAFLRQKTSIFRLLDAKTPLTYFETVLHPYL